MKLELIFTVIFLSGIAITPNVYAQSIDCTKEYTVKSGDTLEKIAQRAYGRGSAFQLLFDANRHQIDRQDLIRPGQKLSIPCPRAPEPTPEFQESHQTVDSADVEILTASDYSPFTHEALSEGGMLTEVVKATFDEAKKLRLGGQNTNYRIDFINDWSKHLTVLLPLRKYDIGFPWYKPDCTRIDELGPKSKLRCEKYYFSDVLYEVVVSYYSHREKGLQLNSADELKGKTICRPSGYFTFDLELRGLTPPVVTLLQPSSLDECFNRLVNGDVDIVTMNTLIVDDAIKRLELNDQLDASKNLGVWLGS